MTTKHNSNGRQSMDMVKATVKIEKKSHLNKYKITMITTAITTITTVANGE